MLKVVQITSNGATEVTAFAATAIIEANAFWKACMDDPSVLACFFLRPATHGTYDIAMSFSRS